jgi:hypothetical protein
MEILKVSGVLIYFYGKVTAFSFSNPPFFVKQKLRCLECVVGMDYMELTT